MSYSALNLALEGFAPGEVSAWSVSGAYSGGAEPTTYIPQPQTKFFQQFGSGVSTVDFDFDSVDAINTILGYAPTLVDVQATSLQVEVRATIVVVEIVERGNLIFFIASFDGDPDEVFFSYTKPDEDRPNVDPGFGQAGSNISRLKPNNYAFVMDTTGFAGGHIRWHFWSTGAHQASQFGEVKIPSRPAQLL